MARDSAVSRALSEALKAARVNLGLSIVEVAAQSGIALEACAGVENLTRSVDVIELVRLAQAVGVDAVALLHQVQMADRGDVYAPLNSIAEPHLVSYEVSAAVGLPRDNRPDLLTPPRR